MTALCLLGATVAMVATSVLGAMSQLSARRYPVGCADGICVDDYCVYADPHRAEWTVRCRTDASILRDTDALDDYFITACVAFVALSAATALFAAASFVLRWSSTVHDGYDTMI